MEDLVRRPEISEGNLVKEVRLRLPPGASIEEVLNMTRNINDRRCAETLSRFETVFDMVKYLQKFDYNSDDARRVIGLADHVEAKALIDAGLFNSVWKFMKPEPEPVSCFTRWAGRASKESSKLPCTKK